MTSAINLGTYASVPLEDLVPDGANVIANKIPVQSVITSRRTAIFNPQNGSTFSAGGQINIRIPGESSYLVPNSAVLHFFINVATASATPDDPPALAVINRAVLRANGWLLEDILNVNEAATALVYSHMNPSVYCFSQGTALKTWKWNNNYGAADISGADPSGTLVQAISNINALSYLNLGWAGVATRATKAASRFYGNAVECNLPLAYVYGLFRSAKLFPLANITDMVLELTLEGATAALVSSGSPTQTLSDVYMVADLVELSDEYADLVQRAFMSPERRMGYTLPLDTLTVETRSANCATAGAQDYVFSKSTPFLKGMLITQKPNASLTSQSAYSISEMDNMFVDNNAQCRLFVGSKPQPEYGALDSVDEIFRQNSIAVNQSASVAVQVGLANGENYNKDGTGLEPGICQTIFSFEKMLGLGGDYVELDSIDATTTGGSITFQANNISLSARGNTNRVLGVLEHTRIIEFYNRRMDVKG